MNSKEYLKLSKNTLASQSEEQMIVENNKFFEMISLAHASNICDKLKREIYYKDNNASSRYNKTKEEIDTLALKFTKHDDSNIKLSQDQLDLLHASLGLGSEAGEIVIEILEALIDGRDVDSVNIKEEVGDLLWYAAILCRTFNFTFEDAMQTNINKLSTRYPNKFTSEDAINRNLTKEREILEE